MILYILKLQKIPYLKSEYNYYDICFHLKGETKTKQCSGKSFPIYRLLPVLTFLISTKLGHHKKNVKVCPFGGWAKASKQIPNARYAQESVLCGIRFTETDMFLSLVKGQLLSNTRENMKWMKFVCNRIGVSQKRTSEMKRIPKEMLVPSPTVSEW